MSPAYLKSSIFGASEPDPNHGSHGADGEGPADEPEPAGPARHGRPHRVRVTGRRRFIVPLVALALVVGTGGVAASVLWPAFTSLTASNDYAGSGAGTVSIAVRGGDTSRAIGATLEKAGVVMTARAFSDAAAANPKSSSIQPGRYRLHAKMSARSALAMLLDPVNRTVPQVTIREGLWTSEIIRALSAATGRPLTEYTLALKSPALLGLPAQANGNAQGYLFPSTYRFDADASATEQLQTMVAKSLDELHQLGVTPAQMRRVLTIASITEAEVRAKSDRPKVARVIENRLATPMRLQMDSTVHFVSGRRGKAGTSTAERRSKSPYNTYLVAGLPPGPIDSPGLSAMQAAVAPAPGAWLYFVAVNPSTGLTRFSDDAAGHAVNERLFQVWCTAHRGQC